MIQKDTLTRIREVVGEQNFSTALSDLVVYSSDLWPRLTIQRVDGRVSDALPSIVVWPHTPEQVAEVLRVCTAAGVTVVPCGGGSGVCGGAVAGRDSVVLDLKRMDQLLDLDPASMSALVQAGMIGQHLEDRLGERGFTMGHFPSSIMCSTVGGWVATRSAGQYSSRFGKIEDLVVGLEVALPDGHLVQVDAAAPHPGLMDFAQLWLGSEGTLGVVTAVRVRICPMPAGRRFGGFRFVDLTGGLEAMRSVMQAGLRPTLMRLYDPLDTVLNEFSRASEGASEPGLGGRLVDEALQRLIGVGLKDLASALTGPALRQICQHPLILQMLMDQLPLTSQLVLGFEGEPDQVDEQLALASEMALHAGGKDLGPGPGEHWYRHRYAVSFKLPKVFMQGAFAETIEVAGLWRDVAKIYGDARRAVIGSVLLMAHFSHAYREGCSVYFTMAGYAKSSRASLDLYDLTVRAVLSNAMKAGATVSHHHGIGLLKRAFMEQEYRGGEKLFWAAKQALDPACVMNPEKIYPAAIPIPPRSKATEEESDFHSVVYWEHQSRGDHAITPEVPEEIPEILRLAAEAHRVICCQGMFPDGCHASHVSHLDLSRLDRLLALDPVSGTVTAQAGIPIHQLENYLVEKNLTLGIWPRTRKAGRLGDCLATTPPWEGSPLYGTLRENCIGLSAVLPDGTVFMARPCPRRAAGPDPLAFFLGGHGSHGIITAACLRVFPLPAVSETLVYTTPEAPDAVPLVQAVLRRQSALLWSIVGIKGGISTDATRAARMVFQFGGTREAVSRDMAIVRRLMAEGKATETASRNEERINGASKHPVVERFLPWREIVACLQRLSDDPKPAVPDAVVSDATAQGALLRLVCREESQAFAKDLVRRMTTQPDPVLTAAALRLKRCLDPDLVLNCNREGGDEDGRKG